MNRRAHEDRRGVGHVLRLALVDRELRRWPQVGVGRIELELQAQLAGEVLDRADVGEGLGEPPIEEPVERVALDGDKVRQRQDLVEVRERETLRACGNERARVYSSRELVEPEDVDERLRGRASPRTGLDKVIVTERARQPAMHSARAKARQRHARVARAGYRNRARRSSTSARRRRWRSDPWTERPGTGNYLSSTVAPAASS